MNLDTFFAYSESTATTPRLFPSVITDIYDRPFSIVETSEQYRLFVLTLASMQGSFVTRLLHSVKSQLKTFEQDTRWLILSPGCKEQLRQLPQEEGVTWIHSPVLAKQLKLYINTDEYLGHFLLEVHPSRRWELMYQFAPSEDHTLAWLGQSLMVTRSEWEQRASQSVKLFDECLTSTRQIKETWTVRRTTWGWHDCPVEIQWAILEQMDLKDVIQCARASHNLRKVITPWLLVKIHTHLVPLKYHLSDLTLKTLQMHERHLSMLFFQLQSYFS